MFWARINSICRGCCAVRKALWRWSPEATLATQPLPRFRGVAMLFFDRLESAALAVEEILPFGPCACDLLDRRHLSLARETIRGIRSCSIPADAEAVLLVEHSGDDSAAVRDRLRQTVDRVRRKKQLAFDSRQAFDAVDVELFWQLARRVRADAASDQRHRCDRLPMIEDLAVPPASLPDFLVRMQNALKRHQVTASLYGHVGHGQLHIRPFLDLNDAGRCAKDGRTGRRTVRRCVRCRRNHQRRARRRTQPHAVCSQAIRRAV